VRGDKPLAQLTDHVVDDLLAGLHRRGHPEGDGW
jgi:hypothetical protein